VRGQVLGYPTTPGAGQLLTVAKRILFESRGQFPGCPGATNQAAIEGRDCLRFGGSGSDFAEEPAARVQSRPRRL
jgi:hypothetical protein